MLRTALIVALTVSQVPEDVPVPAELSEANVEVVVQATQNHFAASNLSPYDQVLLFGTPELGTTATVRLAPGGRVVYPFARGSADEVWVEVVALDEAAWRNTGALSVRDVQDSHAGALWVQRGPGRSVGWLQGEGGLEHLRPESGLVPAALLAARPELVDYRVHTAVHVPVPLPKSDDVGGDEPPVIEKKVLRPV